jgi:hypothetical protein
MSGLKMFIERLLTVLVIIAIVLGFPFITMWLLNKIHPDLPEFIFLTIVFIALLVYFSKFIIWLFIEPFMKKRK